MINRNLISISLAAVALAACAPPPPPPPDVAAIKSAIEAANAKFASAAKAGNVATMTAGYDANAVLMAPNDPPAVGTAGLTKWFGGMTTAFTLKEFSLKAEDVVASGSDYAIETGSFTMLLSPKPKGKDVPDQGKYLVVWKKQADGSWKIFRDIWNSTAPAAPAGK